MPELRLRAHELEIALGGHVVLARLSFAAKAGAITAILGPNGAGKSTLIKAMAGLLPYRGSITVDGAELAHLAPRARARLVAYVPQHSLLDDAVFVQQVVEQGRYAHGTGLGGLGAEGARLVREAMDDTDTTRFSARSFTELSYGERRRVLIARALATGAEILLLDEPSASLDLAHALGLYDLLRTLAASGRCIILALHDLDAALHLADHCLLLGEGKLVACGPTKDVLFSNAVPRVFGIELVPYGGLGYRLWSAP